MSSCRSGGRSLSVPKHRHPQGIICYASENPRSFVFCLHLEEKLVEVRVVVELGVEGDTELVALAGGDDTAVDFG